MRTDEKRVVSLLALVLALGAGSGRAEESESRVAELERRVEQLEATESQEASGVLPEWTRRLRLGGSANAGWYGGEGDSVFHDESFLIWDARFFLDAELGEAVRLGDATLVRNVGFSFEWDLVRLGNDRNRVGDLYVDFQGLGNSTWANVQVGRFQIPVGESYLRFGKGYSDNPFITNTIGGPWYWDEGIRMHGADAAGRFGYVASLADGETAFNADANSDPQVSLKLWSDPTRWLHLSVSGLYTGKLGSRTETGEGALWLGEAWARAFGSRSSVANFVEGDGTVPDGPSRIDETWLIAADVIASDPDRGRLWLSYGTYSIDQDDARYDRRLHYWIAELILYGKLLSPVMRDFYLGLRANGLGTYDSGEGYLLDFRYGGSLGYNMESFEAYSAVIGWKVLRFVTLRAEYTHADIDMVRGVTPDIRGASDDVDSWGIEVGVHF